MSPRHKAAQPKTPEGRVTVIEIDGNSIAAVAISKFGAGFHIEGIEHFELDRLVEVIERIHHPIFMDAARSSYPEIPLLASRLKDLLEREPFRNPVVSVLSPEKCERLIEAGPEVERIERRHRMLQSSLPINPLAYPCSITFLENPKGRKNSQTRMLKVRLMDLFPVGKLIERISASYIGAVPAQGAAARILQLVAQDEHEEAAPRTLCHIGKLRTLYTTLLPDGTDHHNDIPVGLARDDMHYFRSITPDTAQLNRLKLALGSLFFPAEVTPTPVSSAWMSSPQIDCTRFGAQIAHYAARFHQSTAKGTAAIQYLCGRASRIMGLRQYIEQKSGLSFRRIDRRPIPGVSLAPGLKWADVADNILAVGAAVVALAPLPETIGRLNMDFHSPPIESYCCSVAAMEDRKSYVFVQRIELC